MKTNPATIKRLAGFSDADLDAMRLLHPLNSTPRLELEDEMIRRSVLKSCLQVIDSRDQ